MPQYCRPGELTTAPAQQSTLALVWHWMGVVCYRGRGGTLPRRSTSQHSPPVARACPPALHTLVGKSSPDYQPLPDEFAEGSEDAGGSTADADVVVTLQLLDVS